MYPQFLITISLFFYYFDYYLIGYTGAPLETFPTDQRKVSSFNAFINKEIIPSIYWNGLLSGRWTGPTQFRKAFSHLRSSQ